MTVSVTFYVTVSGTAGYLYPKVPRGLPSQVVPVSPGPLPSGRDVTVQAILVEDDPNLPATLFATVDDASASMPASWQLVESNGFASHHWRFRPTGAGSVTLRARLRLTSSHSAMGQLFSNAISLHFVEPDAITLGGPLPIEFRVRFGGSSASYVSVEPGGLVRVPVGRPVEVHYRIVRNDPITGAVRTLVNRAPVTVHPPFPASWSVGFTPDMYWSLVPQHASSFRFTAEATLLEAASFPPGSVPTRRHLQRGRASFDLRVDPSLTAIVTETLADRGRVDPDNLRPDDVPLMSATSIEGVWRDAAGDIVEIATAGDAVAMRFGRGASATMIGARTGPNVAVRGRFPSIDELPDRGAAAALAGIDLDYHARVSDDGRALRGRLAPADPGLAGGVDLVLARRAEILAVQTVCTSLRDFLYEIDATRPWDDRSLVGTLMSIEVDTRWDDAHVFLVVGNYLPQEGSQPDASGPLPVSLDEHDVPSDDRCIRYLPDRLWRTRNSGGFLHGEILAPMIRDLLWERGWDQLAEALGEPQRLQMQTYPDALLVVAYPEQGVLAGPKSFSLGGQAIPWRLESPVTRASLDLVRNVIWPDVWLPVDSIVRNCEFYIQLKVAADIDMDSFDVLVQLGGDGDQPVKLDRLANDRLTYRSGPLMIAMTGEVPSDTGSAHVIATAARDIVVQQARALLRLAVPVTTARIVTSPTLLGAYFPYHLSHAASVKNLPIDDEAVVATYHDLVVMDSTITLVTGIPPGVAPPAVSYIPLVRGYSDLDFDISIPIGIPGLPHLELSPGVRSTEVAMGDHAAALLLLDQLKRMLGPVRDQLREAVADEQATAAYVRAQFRAIVRDQDTLSRIEVEDSRGDDVELRRAIAIGHLRSEFSTRASANDYAVRTTGAALRVLLDAVEDAMQRAETIDADDIEELLKLTGHGFQAVVSRAMPLLVRRADFSEASGDYVWRTDEIGVRWVGDVEYVAALLQANHDLARADTNVLLAAAAIVPVFLPAGLLRALIAAGLSVFDLAELGLSLYEQHRELSFALGASPVIGRDRLSLAEAQQTPLWLAIVTAGLSLLGGVGDLADLVGEASVALARARAGRLVKVFEDGGIDALRRMSRDDQRDLLVAIFDARATAREAGGIVDVRTSRLLAAADLLEEEALALARAARRAELAAEASSDLAGALPADLRDRIPVIVDDTLGTASAGTAAEVRLMYEMDEAGFVTGLSVRVAQGATQADVASHLGALRCMDDYTRHAHESRGLVARFRRWVTRFGEPPPGSVAWESRLEVEKLTSVLVEDRIGRLASGQLDASSVAVQQDLAWLGEQLAYHARVVADLDLSPGRGFVAAHSVESLHAALNAMGATTVLRRRPAPVLSKNIADRIALVSSHRTAQHAAADHAALEALVGGWMRLTMPDATVQSALDMFRRINGSESAREALMRVPGIESVLGDLVESEAKRLGAHWLLRFNARLRNMDAALGQEVLDLLGGRAVRLFEDMIQSTPRNLWIPDDGGGPLREFWQGIDQVMDDGTMLEFKSYRSWAAVVAKIEEQAPKTFVRYADAGWCDGSGQALNGRYLVFVDARRLEVSARTNVASKARELADSLASWANTWFGGSPTIDVRIFIL